MGHLERGRNLKLLQAARESIFPIYLAFFCISDRSKKIRGTRQHDQVQACIVALVRRRGPIPRRAWIADY